jgi:hypothetical protein
LKSNFLSGPAIFSTRSQTFFTDFPTGTNFFFQWGFLLEDSVENGSEAKLAVFG